MNLTYFSNLPNPPDDPADDVGGMQINSASINSWVGIDHLGFGTNIGGYHNLLHLVDQKTSPDPSSPIGKFYNQTPNGGTDTILFYKSAGGVLTQLSGIQPDLADFNGYVWINGILLQWGFVNGTHSGGNHTFNPGDTGTVTFNTPFPNKIFNVTTSINFNSNTAKAPSTGSAVIIALDYFNTTTTGFAWQAAGSGGSYTVFYWTAIGF